MSQATHQAPRATGRLAVILLLLLAGVASDTAAETRQPGLRVEGPGLALRGVTAKVTVTPSATPAPATDSTPVFVELRDAGGQLLAKGQGLPGEPLILEANLVRGGTFRVDSQGQSAELKIRTVPGWLSLLPALLAILLALLTRQVVPALLGGVWVGAWILYANPFVAALRTIDGFIVGTLADGDRVSIVIFSMLLGGMVAIVSRSGGTIGLVEALTPYATSSRRGQLVTWLLGLMIFFDDYANTLLVGNTMRPVTDRLRISREKLAYIVDSTAAPVASVALVSTWIGYEVSLIADALERIGSTRDAYAVFIQSLPYRFYPILALFFGLLIASTRRDFGPMLAAERRARSGKLLADGAVPLADFDHSTLQAIEDKPHRWFNAVIPVAAVVLVAFVGLWFTGRASLGSDGAPEATAALLDLGLQGIGSVFSAGNSFQALLWGSLTGCILALTLAVAQRVLTLEDGLRAWLGGLKSMVVAIVILILAWSISDVCDKLHTADYLAAMVSDRLDPRLLPLIVFVLAAMISFATGTSWGTMGILMPLSVPTAHAVAQAAGLDPAEAHRILLGAVSSVLAGAIFGDHCSPISDTTVMSSMASGCDHVDHVKTQLPYALAVAGSGIVLGDLPSAFGLSPWIGLLAGAALLATLLYYFGRTAAD